MGIILIILVFFGIIVCIVEAINIITYGSPISSKHYNNIIKNLSKYRKNHFDNEILSVDFKLPYISKGVHSFLFYGQIDGVGLIWRWSKLAKEVDKRLMEVNYGDNINKPIDVFYE